MKPIKSFSFTVLACFALTQCKTIEIVRNKLPGGPPVTTNVDGNPYYEQSVSRGNLNAIAAKVDDSIVTNNEFNFLFNPVAEQLRAQFPRKGSSYYREYSKAKKEILEELIDRELVMNEFSDLGAKIPPRVIDQEIDRRINTIYNGKRSLYLADLKKNGLSQSKYRNLVERNMAVSAMKAQHSNDYAPPTTAELNKEYSKFRDKLRDISKDQAAYKKIWLPYNTGEFGVSRETELELAEDLVAQLKKGASFSELAQEHSSDVYADKGGQWPLTKRIDFPTHFAPAVFGATIGKIIGPLEDPSGFHIIKVTKKVNGPSPPLSAVRADLERRVAAEKSSERYDRWLNRLRQKAKITRYR